MRNPLGITGIVGIVIVFAGLAVVTWQEPIIGGGLALMLVGLALIVKSAINAVVNAMGMGGMF